MASSSKKIAPSTLQKGKEKMDPPTRQGDIELDANFVMATNSSSIVSKRSVERLYHPEPHYFRYFVRKPQRRAPVINRGYWLRMHAIDHVIRCFLMQKTEKRKVIINLGCGYDPMPFQWLGQRPDECRDTTFVDIDYLDLMKIKVNVINNTPQLRSLLGEPTGNETPNDFLLMDTQRYYAVGCDLGNTDQLTQAMQTLPWLKDSSILFVAEVSVTYMEVEKADQLLEWTSRLGAENQFCLLEQFLPDGRGHPFADTMLRHFKKLRSPLRCISTYPSLQAQETRFSERGWKNVRARNLWDLWSDKSFLSQVERLKLDTIEPFDEWEEFALFSSYYFLLHASTTDIKLAFEPTMDFGPGRLSDGPVINLKHQSTGCTKSYRKHGAALALGDQAVGLHGGIGTSGRLSSTDVFCNVNHQEAEINVKPEPPSNIAPRVCHTITQLHDGSWILVGGRTSPNDALKDCWLLEQNTWKRVSDLPSGRYRHCSAPVTLDNGESGLLVVGGKETGIHMQESWLLWTRSAGFRPIQTIMRAPDLRFGATMVATGKDCGIIFGGMRQDGVVMQDIWTWTLLYTGSEFRGVTCKLYQGFSDHPELGAQLCRLGCSATLQNGKIVIAGGVARSWCIPEQLEIILLDVSDLGQDVSGSLKLENVSVEKSCGDRPLLVGHSSIAANGTETLILGGGAVCFSFGSFWNGFVWSISDSTVESKSQWSLRQNVETKSSQPSASPASNPPASSNGFTETIQAQHKRIESAVDFDEIMSHELPCILQNLDFGPCTGRWTNEYLKDTIGPDRQVIIHEASTSMMSFHAKDFKYVTRPFTEFLDMAAAGSNVYLRSLSSKNKSEMPTNFKEDYPELASDFTIPPPLAKISERMHSSPFRISTAGIWLHYDVQANCLFQVRGSKKLILFPPDDVLRLQFPPGSTTSGLSIFDTTGQPTHIPGTRPVEVNLNAGDVLFIPPLWPHTAAPVQGMSVAINVFFRNLDDGYAAGRDVYGNRDLQAYETGRKQIEKIIQSFRKLPPSVSNVYIQRLADELKSAASPAP